MGGEGERERKGVWVGGHMRMGGCYMVMVEELTLSLVLKSAVGGRSAASPCGRQGEA